MPEENRTERTDENSASEKDTEALRAEAIRLNMRLARLHRCAFAGTASTMGMPHSQHRMLMFLFHHEGLSQKEIAQNMETSTAAVAAMLKRMEAEGLLSRTPASKDSRVNEIRLTERGRQAVNRTTEIFGKIDAVMFDGFSREDFLSYIALQTKINRNLSTLTPHADRSPDAAEASLSKGENTP